MAHRFRDFSVLPSSRQSSLRRAVRLLPIFLIGLAGGATVFAAQALAAPSESPEVQIRGAKLVTKTSATIEVGINPEGSQTSYEIWLECQSADRDNQACEPLTVGEQLQQGVIASGFEVHAVLANVEGLQPGYLYKYRVVATNSVGKAGWVGSGLVTCPSEGVCPMQPFLEGEELWILEGANKDAEEAPRLEAEREARRKEEEERPGKEAMERVAEERAIREAGERAGREAAEREAAAASQLRCVVPRLGGDSLSAARRALDKAHCRLGRVTEPRTHHGALVVGSQTVRSGRKLVSGAKVAVTLRPVHHHASRRSVAGIALRDGSRATAFRDAIRSHLDMSGT